MLEQDMKKNLLINTYNFMIPDTFIEVGGLIQTDVHQQDWPRILDSGMRFENQADKRQWLWISGFTLAESKAGQREKSKDWSWNRWSSSVASQRWLIYSRFEAENTTIQLRYHRINAYSGESEGGVNKPFWFSILNGVSIIRHRLG